MKYELLIDTPGKKKGEIVETGHDGLIWISWPSRQSFASSGHVILDPTEWPATFKPVKELKEIRFVRVEDRPAGSEVARGEFVMRHPAGEDQTAPYFSLGGRLPFPFTVYRREEIYQ